MSDQENCNILKITSNQEMIDYLNEVYQNQIPLNMFRAMIRALKEDNLQNALAFYKNDMDKLDTRSDKHIRDTIDWFFTNKGLEVYFFKRIR